eukprot:5408745-Prorocentrum_lima.AAC.1
MWQGGLAKLAPKKQKQESHRDYRQLSLMSTSAKVVQTAGKQVLSKLAKHPKQRAEGKMPGTIIPVLRIKELAKAARPKAAGQDSTESSNTTQKGPGTSRQANQKNHPSKQKNQAWAIVMFD